MKVAATAAPRSQSPSFLNRKRRCFLLSVHRLADSPYFSAHLVIQGLDETRARKHLQATQGLISRLHDIVHKIRQQFPSL